MVGWERVIPGFMWSEGMDHIDMMDTSVLELSRVPNWKTILNLVVISNRPNHTKNGRLFHVEADV